MSEIINNREYRQKVLKDIILQLHGGSSVAEVRARFAELIHGVSAAEIAEMEQALIREGMPLAEIQRLCDVHAAVFQGTIEEIHRERKPEETPGHPVYMFRQENRAMEARLSGIKPLLQRLKAGDTAALPSLRAALEALVAVDRHYARKENLLFPFLEKYGITAPPKVMWGVHDEIRASLRESIRLIQSGGTAAQILEKADQAVTKAAEMISKEENILFPMALETLSEDEWLRIRKDSGEIGYCFVEPEDLWKPANENVEQKMNGQGETPADSGYLRMEPGVLTPEEIQSIFNTLPVDLTFVDKDGTVKYFSQTKDRIFPRPASVIGRQVSNCHPPASVHIVERIVEDLKAGRRDHEDFWIRMGEKYVYIRYFAVRNRQGTFLGILEVTQDIRPIQELTGEKRLLSE